MPGHLLAGKWRIADRLHPSADAIMLNPWSGQNKTEPSIWWTQMSGRPRHRADPQKIVILAAEHH
jgi:hypothetical protein